MLVKDLIQFAIVTVLAIFSGVVLAMLYSLFNPADTVSQPQTHTPRPQSPAPRFSLTTPEFDAQAYYRPILEYNLFRPLGWTPPVPIEPYRLIGTILPRSENKHPQAIIETTTGRTTHIVSPGDYLDAGTEVISIKEKSVTIYSSGRHRTLRLLSAF